MTKLSVNLNKIALVRNSRDGDVPSVLHFGNIALAAGAHGLTVHPRPDERHIRRSDVPVLAQLIAQEYPDAEFNIEGYPSDDWLSLIEKNRPHQATLVPDSPDQKTSDHGWDLRNDAKFLESVVTRIREMGVRVSLFVDPEPETVALAREIGADRVELYTEPYALAFGASSEDDVLKQYSQTASAAQQAGLGVNAGHDLNLKNLTKLLKIPGIEEVSIGHALTADALEMGMAEAIEAYLAVLLAYAQ